MRLGHKRAFYLDPVVEAILLKAPSKKISERANELMRKGIQKEYEEAIADEYRRCGEELSKQDCNQDSNDNLSSTQLSYRLFENDDSSDENLI